MVLSIRFVSGERACGFSTGRRTVRFTAVWKITKTDDAAIRQARLQRWGPWPRTARRSTAVGRALKCEVRG